jgi:hypothetical protein
VSDNDSECDEEKEDDFSDNVLDLLSEQSDTTDVTGYSISTCTVSGGTEVSVKKTKIMLTEEEPTFAKKFQPVVSKIDSRDSCTCYRFVYVFQDSCTCYVLY